jgi:hypothetical protein
MPFQAGNLTEKIPRIYREHDREYDRELKLNTPKRVRLAPFDLPLPICPLTPPPTFAVTPPGWRAWVLAHPRNLATRSTTDGIAAYAAEFDSR